MIGKTLAHYTVTAKLGEGGMGEVYRATDTKLGRDVALKLLPADVAQDPERVARLEREARTLATLQHPNVASIYGFETVDGRPFLVMELVEGEDLSSRLAQGALSRDEALAIADQIVEGLDAAHAKGIVHRDLKPANIKLAGRQVKILDFGLARAFSEEQDEPNLTHSPTITAGMTQAGVILGTAAYMSPEQARGKPVDKRTDIWAFGCVLLEMLSGEQVYSGETVSDVIARILEREPNLDTLPADTPRAVRRLLRRCLVKDRKDRLHDIADARLELADARTEEPLESVAAAPAAAAGRLSIVPWVLVVALAAVLAWSLWPEPAAPREPTRFTVAAPEGHILREFSIAPDGRSLVFVAAERLGDPQLWIRRFDSVESEPLPDTLGATFPFWSPDSRSVAFFGDGRLRRIDLATRTVRSLTDAANGRGGAWSDDGTIVFTPEGLDVLYTIPDSGGTAQPLTTLTGEGLREKEETHRFPHFLPGSRAFTYVTQPRSDYFGHSYMTTLDAPDERTQLWTDFGEVYGVDDYLLAAREGILYAHRFDPKAREVVGDPQPLASSISIIYPRTGRSSFSVSRNGVLAYRSIRSPVTMLAWYTRAGVRIEEASTADTHAWPRLSPDGSRVTFIRGRRTNPDVSDNDVWILDLERGTTFALTQESRIHENPRWWPDGKSVVYSTRGGVLRHVLDGTSGAEVVVKAEDLGHDINRIEVSKDSRWMLLQAWNSTTDWDLWILDLEKGPDSLRPFVEAPGLQADATISPDGNWVAYRSAESGLSEIYVQRLDGSGARRVISSRGGVEPMWSEDGSELYYVAPDQMLMAIPIEAGDPMRATAAKKLFEAPRLVAAVFEGSG